MTTVPDPDGKYFRKEIWDRAKAEGSGWTDYKFKNPLRTQIERKTAYFKKEGELVLVCGAYKAN